MNETAVAPAKQETTTAEDTLKQKQKDASVASPGSVEADRAAQIRAPQALVALLAVGGE